MTEATNIEVRGRTVPGRGIARSRLTERLVGRAVEPVARKPIGGERVRVAAVVARPVIPGGFPGSPAPLLGRLVRHKLTLQPVGPVRGSRGGR